jgi:hypothetical protein
MYSLRFGCHIHCNWELTDLHWCPVMSWFTCSSVVISLHNVQCTCIFCSGCPATSITIGVSNATTNGYYIILPSVTLVGGSGSGAIVTVVLTNGRVSSIVVSGTMTGYVETSLSVVVIQSPPSFPHMIRLNNLHSKSIVHSDNGGTTNVVKKGGILHTGILNDEPVVPIKIVLEQQIINNISLSVDRTISGNSGIPDFIEFLICLKLTEYEPHYIMYGSMNNVNVNQQIG